MRPPRQLNPSPHHHIASRRLALFLAAAALTACTESAIPTNPPLAAPSSSAASTKAERATAPATLAWELTARNQVKAHPAYIPIVAGRAYALLGVAQYGAAVASDDALGVADGDAPIGADDGGRAQYESRRGAIGEASRVVLTALFADSAAPLQAQLDAESIGPNGKVHPQFTRGVAIGHAMGLVMNHWAANDGFSAQWDSVALQKDPLHPERWYQANPKISPSGFQYPAMRPYFMTSAAQFHPDAPPAFGSTRFLTDLQEVRDIAKHPRSQAQIDSANFWNLPQTTVTALGYWDEQADTYIKASALGDRSASHIFALTNAAAMDATIGCWEAKYSYLMLRPFQNPPPTDFVFTTVFNTPNHPSYPSGHSCVSAAAATVLEHFFPEKATDLEKGVKDAGRSRVLAGIHYQFDIDAGQKLGRKAGDLALDYDRTQGLLAAVKP